MQLAELISSVTDEKLFYLVDDIDKIGKRECAWQDSLYVKQWVESALGEKLPLTPPEETLDIIGFAIFREAALRWFKNNNAN